ncbi:MAG TPA: hypothetical protein VGG21_09135 [Acidimicrobiales bacterium]|jgi:hypothetical protein
MTAPTALVRTGSDRDLAADHRGSPLPNGAMIRTRMMELRKRRGLMWALIIVFVGIPTIFLTVRLIMHGVDPKAYQPAGGYDIFNNLISAVLFILGFIVAATLGSYAGSVDLNEGVFRHLVVTGRSRVALYLARIPAGLAILVPIVAAGFTIVCAVCCFAAPPKLNFDGLSVPSGLTRTAFVQYAGAHPGDVVCQLPSRDIPINVPCGPNGIVTNPKRLPPGLKLPSHTQLVSAAEKIAAQNYRAYSDAFRVPSTSLMIKTGLWVELEAVIGFIVGLGLASLMGQRTVPVMIMIVFSLFLTPLLVHTVLKHFINVQRLIVGAAMARIEPRSLSPVYGSNGPFDHTSIPMSITASVAVIVGWVIVWTALGAWKMTTRDV